MDNDRLLDRPEGVPRWVPEIDDEVSVRRLRWAITVLLVLCFLGWVSESADGPADPVVTQEPLPTAPPNELAPTDESPGTVSE